MKQPDLYYFETMQMTSQAQSEFTENTRLQLVFSIQNLTRLVTSFLWFKIAESTSIETWLVSKDNKCPLGEDCSTYWIFVSCSFNAKVRYYCSLDKFYTVQEIGVGRRNYVEKKPSYFMFKYTLLSSEQQIF